MRNTGDSANYVYGGQREGEGGDDSSELDRSRKSVCGTARLSTLGSLGYVDRRC
jgi:hypothetical protein